MAVANLEMVNPYDPPISTRMASGPIKSVPTWALRAFGVFPAAIIVAYMTESILFPTRGWNAEDWFWAIGPPVYLFAVWMFALLNDHRNSRRLTVCLAVLILPLILFALHVWSVAGNWFIFASKMGLDGFGINENYRLFAVIMPLWLAASAVWTLYLYCLMRKLMRLRN